MALPSAETRRDSAEVEILVACARLALAPGASERIARLADGGVDWQELLALAEPHAMIPLLHRHLGAVAGIPKPVLVELWGRHEAIARDNRAMARELERVIDALDAIGVAAIPYKGPTLAFFVYGDVALRDFCDLDILVRRRDVLRARRALEALGYAADYPLDPRVERAFLRSPSQYHLGMSGPGATVVELHWKTDAACPVERDDEAWWSGAPTARFGQRPVRVFAARELLLVLCLHGSKHGWERLAWLADVAELIRGNPSLEWEWIFARAGALGGRRRLALGLHLAHRLLGAPLPARVLAEAAKDPRVARIAAEIRAILFTRGNVFREGVRALRFNLGLYERISHRVAHVHHTLLAPSLVEWTRWPLPRALYFLYPPLRLARLLAKHSRRGRTQRAAAPAKPA